MATSSKKLTQEEQLQQKKQAIENTPQEDKDWFFSVLKELNFVSPFHPYFFRKDELYDGLFSGISDLLLRQELPVSIKNKLDSIIEVQFGEELSFWVDLYQKAKSQTPSFLLYTNKNNKDFEQEVCDNYINWLYVPLQKNYKILLDDIITFNYSTFSIDQNIFKK